jgi:glycerophosphoryl diester phosphodiesterase
MRVFGHGAGNDINTLPSFARMQALGVDGVELDVRRTVDDALAVTHDPVGESLFESLDVPSLDQALGACRDLLVNIEIKNFPRDPDFDPTQRVTDLVLDLLDKRGGSDDVLISCFDGACLRRCNELPTALLMLSRRPPGELLEAADGFRVVHPYDSMVNEEFMVQARERGLTVNVWTGEDESLERMTELARLGVDGIITSAPEVALAARAQR